MTAVGANPQTVVAFADARRTSEGDHELQMPVSPVKRALEVVVGVLGLGTAAGFLDRVSWVFEPATLFRLQYALLLLAVTPLALAFRQWPLALAAVTLAAVNVAVIAPWQGAPREAAFLGGPTMRIVALNVESGNHQYGRLAPLLARIRPDVLGLAELTPDWARAARKASTRLKPRRLNVEPGAYGVGIFSTTRPTTVTTRRFPADGPNAIIARFRLGDLPVTIVMLHVHTPFAGSVHARELRALAAARPQLGRRLVVCGDFNTVPWSAQFEDFARSAGLTDAFRGSWLAHSWPSVSPSFGALIDHCLVSDGLAIRDREIGPSIGSDHLPLILDIGIARMTA